MVTKEIRKFVIKQMIEADWINGGVDSFISKNLKITLNKDDVKFTIRNSDRYSSNGFDIERKELGLNKIYFWFLLFYIKRSCRLSDKKSRESKLEYQWKKFLDNNKDIKRDSTLDKILD